MKLTTIILFAFCLQVGAKSTAQSVTLSVTNMPFANVCKLIQKQTGYHIFYDTEVRQNIKNITLTLRNENIDQAMHKILEGSAYMSLINEKVVVIKNKMAEKMTGAEALTDVVTEPVTVDIKGRIRNENGLPVPRATVRIKGTEKVTISDDNGAFELKGVKPDAEMIISSVGYEKKEFSVKGITIFDILLHTYTSQLDETVVQAYGTTTQRYATGNIARVTSKDIESQPVSNPLMALSGRVPGVVITQTNGTPGSTIKVQVRGQNSIGTSPGTLPLDNPLFIIDGVPFAPGNTSMSQMNTSIGNSDIGVSPFSSINPSDIESIEILKDADATAIYGSRGANGVILVTTKKPQAGKTRFTANVYTGGSQVSRMLPFMNTQQYLQMRHEAFANDGVTPTKTNAYDFLVWDSTRYTDFSKLLIGGTAHTTDANASVTGGNNNTQYMLGGGYHHESTVFPGEMGDNRISMHFNVNSKSTDGKFRINLLGTFAHDKNNESISDMTQFVYSLSPTTPTLYDSLGHLNWQSGGVYFNNPLNLLFQPYSAATDNLNSNLLVSYDFFKGFTFRVSGGYNSITLNELQLRYLESQSPRYTQTGTSIVGYKSNKDWIVEPQAEYTTQIRKHRLNILVGATDQYQWTNGNVITGTGYTSNALLQNISSAPTQSSTTTASQYRYAALFGRINYNFDNKYILNLSARRDGSSRFGPGNQYGNFGAVGAAWIFTNENWVKDHLFFLSFGKLRTSYGTTGSDNIGDYQYLNTWTPVSSSFRPYQTGIIGLTPSHLNNPDFQWQVNKKWEVAMDLGILRDRIIISPAYYINRSSNQLTSFTLPRITGFPSVLSNFPATVQNSGFELVIQSKNIETKNFTWKTFFNLSIPRNKLVDFPGITKTSYNSYYQIGQPLSVIYKLVNIGVDPNTGVYTYLDANKDGNLSLADFQSQGYLGPKYTGGLQNDLTYKGFTFSFFIQFTKQTGPNYSQVFNNLPGGINTNMPTIAFDQRWKGKGDNRAYIQQFTQDASSQAYQYGSAYYSSSGGAYTDASFIKLKNIYLTYNLPKIWLNKVHLQNCKVFLQGQNLVTITNYWGLDPETQAYNKLPTLKTFAGGIQFSF